MQNEAHAHELHLGNGTTTFDDWKKKFLQETFDAGIDFLPDAPINPGVVK